MRKTCMHFLHDFLKNVFYSNSGQNCWWKDGLSQQQLLVPLQDDPVWNQTSKGKNSRTMVIKDKTVVILHSFQTAYSCCAATPADNSISLPAFSYMLQHCTPAPLFIPGKDGSILIYFYSFTLFSFQMIYFKITTSY